MRKKLSREEILRNILKYKLQQRRRKAAGECLPRLGEAAMCRLQYME